MANSTRFRGWFNDFYYVISEYLYLSILVGAVLLATLTLGAWYGYRWYTLRQNYTVYELLDQCAKEFDYAAQQNKAPEWESVAQFCAAGYKAHSTNKQAPYFLPFQAEALIQKGERAQAVEVLDTMLAQLSTQSPLYYLYATKRALLLFDLDSEESAIKELTALATKKDNAYSDYAAYQLGYYYWVRNDVEKARSVWKTLIEQVPDEILPGYEKTASPWAVLAKSKLGTISLVGTDEQGVI